MYVTNPWLHKSFIEVTSRFSSFVVSFLVSVAMVSVELLVPVPLSARVLPLADVDAAICKTENNTTLSLKRD